MIELISVVYGPELPLLKIQAQSIQEHISDVERITVVVNDATSLTSAIDPQWWGRFASRVNIISRERWNYTSRINGWEEQQLCKLMAASEAQTTWSVVLDAKTWYIRDLDYTKLFDEQGRATTGTSRIFKEFADSHRFIETYFNIKTTEVIGPQGVPFLFHTDTVRALVNSVPDFPEFFQTHVRYPDLVTEFHLYSGWVLQQYGTFDKLYNPTQYYGCHNTSQWQVGDFDADLTRIQRQNSVITASVHQKAYALMQDYQLNNWVNFLQESGVVSDPTQTLILLNTFSSKLGENNEFRV